MSEEKSLTQEKVAEIRKEFDFFDQDQNGQIDSEEFFELLKTISPKVKKEQALEGFSFIDENQDGVVDFNEFLNWWQKNWWEY